ncbi:MAG: glycosyltransferase [Raineya sp.]|nr:glycosyltransferase [Raineya sp.]
MKTYECKIVLPAYNESENIKELLERIISLRESYQLPISILVVNDGSTDTTLEIVHKFKEEHHFINYIDVQPNQGLANAIREGLVNAVKELKDNDIVVTMDADNSHNPFLVYRMILQIFEGSDIVIASRYQKGSRIIGLSKYREILSIGASLLFRIFFPIKGVKDYTCGYRAYKVAFLRKMLDKYQDKFIEEKGFACMIEILLKAKKLKPVIHELPFILRYDFKKGQSKMKIYRTIKQTLRLLFKR